MRREDKKHTNTLGPFDDEGNRGIAAAQSVKSAGDACDMAGGGGVWRTDCYSVLAQKKEMWCENDCMLSDKHLGGGGGGGGISF